MRKTMHLGLHAYFHQVSLLSELRRIRRRLPMRHAEETYWKNQEEEAVLQEFDGLQGYLYFMDIVLDTERQIPFNIEKADLHIVYILSDEAPVNIDNQQGSAICQVPGGRAVYLYIPPDDYQFHLPKGCTKIFGFYFRASIFRRGNDRAYEFLHPLLAAHRQQSDLPLASKDFMVGPKTRHHIETLCENLHPTQLNNDHFISGKILELIELSRIKILNEDSKISHELHIAQEARELLILYIARDGQSAELKKLEADIKLTLPSINRFHKTYFGKTLQKLRDELLVGRACEHLRSGLSPKETAYALNYNSPEAFYHFFKRNKGLSPLSYLKTL